MCSWFFIFVVQFKRLGVQDFGLAMFAKAFFKTEN